MRTKLTRTLMLGVIGILAVAYVVSLSAQLPPPPYVAKTLAKGTFKDDLQIFNQMLGDAGGDLWLAQLRTHGPTDLYVQSNEWQPGGSTGWHSHSGPSLVIVTAGTVTAYDSECIPHLYSAPDPLNPNQQQNSVFIDGAHVHLLRNDSSAVAKTIAVQFVREGAARKLPADAPAGCDVQ